LSIDCVTCAWQSRVLIYPTGLPRRVYIVLSDEFKHGSQRRKNITDRAEPDILFNIRDKTVRADNIRP